MDFRKYFNGLNREEFENKFSTEEQCLKVLADEKWKDGFVCRHCGNDNYCKGKSHHSRRCTRCKHEESAIAHTVLHNCKIPVNKALRIAYMVCNDHGISSHEISRQIDIRQMTCWKFKKKILECMQQGVDVRTRNTV